VIVPSQDAGDGSPDEEPSFEEDVRDLRRLLGGRINEGLEDGPEIPIQRRSPFAWFVAFGMLLAVGLAWLRLDPVARLTTFGAMSRSLSRLGLRPPARLARYDPTPLTPIGRAYWRWSAGLGRLGLESDSTHTPFERARKFAHAYPLEAERGWVIARAYAAERYGGLSPDPSPAVEAWNVLRPWMALLWIEKAPAQARQRLARSFQSAREPNS
jgi:hypothetical protein